MDGGLPSTRRRLATNAMVFAVLPIGSAAVARNGKAHMTVAATAWKNLSPEARAKAFALLRPNPDYSNWIRGASPADTEG